MEAMDFEYLLRRVFGTGRNYSIGADADIYRKMEVAHRNLETKSLFYTEDERKNDFFSKFAKVRIKVDNAISNGVRQVKDLATPEELEKLKKMSLDLNPKMFDKEALDIIIEYADEVFEKYGLDIE